MMPSCSKVITELVTEMPRSCSISIQSERVRRRSPRALHVAGQLDGAAEQQQLLGQRGLAGVRVRDDRERAPARDLALRRIERGSQGGRNLLHLSRSRARRTASLELWAQLGTRRGTMPNSVGFFRESRA